MTQSCVTLQFIYSLGKYIDSRTTIKTIKGNDSQKIHRYSRAQSQGSVPPWPPPSGAKRLFHHDHATTAVQERHAGAHSG